MLVRLFLIFIIGCLSINFLYAQTTDSLLKGLIESASPVANTGQKFYSLPVLKFGERKYNLSSIDAGYFYRNQDIYLPQTGSGLNGFSVNAATWQLKKHGQALWGNAGYSNTTVTGVKYNESLDYEFIYPYVMADTVGGDIKTEHYNFNGGFSKKIRKIYFGVQAGYRGVQNYRNRDPRPKNISSTVDIGLSGGIGVFKNKILALHINQTQYNQNNNLQFENELGAPLIYHDAGLGAYNLLLAGKKAQAYLNGKVSEAVIGLVPSENGMNGLLLNAKFQLQTLNKLLSDISSPVADIQEQKLEINAAYRQQNKLLKYIISVYAGYTDRKGNEGIFSNRGSALGYEKIAEEIKYTLSAQKAGLEIAVETIAAHKTKWLLLVNAAYLKKAQAYNRTDRNMDTEQLVLFIKSLAVFQFKTTQLQWGISAARQQNISNYFYWKNADAISGISQMLGSMYEWYSASNTAASTHIQFSMPAFKNTIAYIKAQGGVLLFSNSKNGVHYNVTAGVSF